MNADWYCINPDKLVRHLLTIKSKYKTIAQIYWWNRETLVRTAVDVQKKYSDVFYAIELNVGCPSPKVMACGGWSWMMKDKLNTLNILKEIKKSIDMPLTLKTRSGLNLDDQKSQFDFILEASNFCEIISIHGRTLKQSHSGDVDWDFIYNVKKLSNSKSKIIWNGWIKSFQEILSCIKNLDWVMVGQSAIGNPWVFSPVLPDLFFLKETILKHLEISVLSEIYFDKRKSALNLDEVVLEMPSLEDLYKFKPLIFWWNKFRSVVEFRKFLFNYVKWLPNSKEFKVRVSSIVDYYELVDEISNFFLIGERSR